MKRQLTISILFLLFCAPMSSFALTLQEFSQLEKEQQGFYLMGVLDTEIIDASFGPERSECVQNWGIKGAYKFLSEWYNRASSDINNINFNVALLVGMEAHKVCKHKRVDSKILKPVK